MFCTNRIGAALFVLCAGLALLRVPGLAARQAETIAAIAHRPMLTADEIVSRLEERNRERAEALKRFEGKRVYRLEYNGVFGERDAEMVVSVSYTSPDKKEFAVLSESGSKFLINHVLKGLLQGEKEAATEKNRQQTDLSAKNYRFTVTGLDASDQGPAYVLEVAPKSNNKFLYRGKIWVDANDFAVTRIEAEPAKSPSFWVKKTEINHKYKKVDDFWLPAENRTDSSIRLGGHALLSINYSDYTITEAASLQPSANHITMPAMTHLTLDLAQDRQSTFWITVSHDR